MVHPFLLPVYWHTVILHSHFYMCIHTDSRRQDVEEITKRHPHKIPIVIEKSKNEKYLPLLDKSKFLVPEELTMSQLTTIIR